jgi:hypothetical protein
MAVLDAVGWPLAIVLAVQQWPAHVGLVGPAMVGVALLCMLSRVRRALWCYHRYRFTNWRWVQVVAAALLVGLLKGMASA